MSLGLDFGKEDNAFPLLDAVYNVVAILFDERGRVVLSSCHVTYRVAIQLIRMGEKTWNSRSSMN